MSSTKIELERKKARLAALRKEMADKEKQKSEDLQIDDILKGIDLNRKQDASLFDAYNANKENLVKKKLVLQISPIVTTTVVFGETVSYCKETQTKNDIDIQPELSHHLEENSILSNHNIFQNSAFDWEMTFDCEMIQNETHDNGTLGKKDFILPTIEEDKAKSLSKEQIEKILQSESLERFVLKCENLISTEISKGSFLWNNYTTEEKDKNRHDGRLILSQKVFGNSLTKGRKITNVNTAACQGDRCIVSYSDVKTRSYEDYSSGLVLIWDLQHSTNDPLKKLNFRSSIRSITTSSYHDQLIFGGSYDGDILIWDLRTNTPLPIMTTSIASEAHHASVFGLFISRFSKNAQLTTIGVDSLICKWSVDMLNKPIETIKVQEKGFDLQQNNTFLCADEVIKEGHETGIFLIGDCAGNVREINSNSKNDEIQTKIISSHSGPVTSLKMRPTDTSRLYLTSSFDYTSKLWSLSGNTQQCIHTFSDLSIDEISQVEWSPVDHDSFAMANCNNLITFWNVGVDSEVPIDSVTLERNTGISSIQFNNEGNILSAGDVLGNLHAYTLNRELLYRP